jgi:aspartyl-tRNA(Asn)/glutamyl-tRNA(Gln) amidotransferase subunit C
MKINIKDVEYVANLARLELSEEENPQQLEKLNKILDYMEILDKVDTKGVQPLAHVEL